MNTKRNFTLLEILVVIAVLGLLAALMIPSVQADTSPYSLAPQQPNFFVTDTNATSFALTNNQTKTFTAGGTNTTPITVRQDHGISLFLTVWQTNSVASTTTNYTVAFDLTGDAVTWTGGNGAYPISWTVSLASQGASTNTYWTNLSAAQLNNIRQMQATKASTTASNNIFGKLTYSYSGQ
jgi:prepilin-type N-terminal cleavage/methylation domain-containing protein